MTRFTCERKVDTFAATTDCPYLAPTDELFEMEVADCFGEHPDSHVGKWTGGANPVTGPLAVEGLEPGDTLAVEIVDLRTVGQGFYGTAEKRVWMHVDQNTKTIFAPGGVRLPLEPHVGTLGVAPAGAPVPTVEAGDHGGNMDCKLLGPGCIVCFRVGVPGAGLGLGDVHAAMGDGEVGGQGVETAAVATLRVRRIPGLPSSRPYGLYRNRLFTIGWGHALSSAADMAQDDMHCLLGEYLSVDPTALRKLLGMTCDLRVCWRGGRTPCMRMELPLSSLPTDAAAAIRDGLGAGPEPPMTNP